MSIRVPYLLYDSLLPFHGWALFQQRDFDNTIAVEEKTPESIFAKKDKRNLKSIIEFYPRFHTTPRRALLLGVAAHVSLISPFC